MCSKASNCLCNSCEKAKTGNALKDLFRCKHSCMSCDPEKDCIIACDNYIHDYRGQCNFPDVDFCEYRDGSLCGLSNKDHERLCKGHIALDKEVSKLVGEEE